MHKSVPKVLLFSAIVLFTLSACTASSGIFAGGNWQASGLAHQHIRSLTVDFNNPQVIYAASSQGIIFSSTDGGQHWTERSSGLPIGSPINALSLDPTGKKLYAATGAGLFMSNDAALHWVAVGKVSTGQPENYTALVFNLKQPHTLYVGTASRGMLKSNDDGNTWSAINTGLPPDTAINSLTFDTGNQQLWAATTSGVYRSDNKGESWQPLNIGLPASIIVYSVQPDTIVNGGTMELIFAGTNHGFFFSQDAGSYWQTSQESLVGTSIRVIYVDFHKPTTVFVGTDVGALRSDNSGQTWGTVGSGMPTNQPVYSLAWGTSDYSQLFAAADGVYIYPGTSGGFGPNQLLELLVAAAFFYALYRLTRRRRRSSKANLIAEQPKKEEKNDLSKTET